MVKNDPDPAIVFVDSEGIEYYNTYGGKIYAYDFDTKELTEFYSDESLIIFSILGVGKYLVVEYNEVDEAEHVYHIKYDKIVLPLEG